jgi:simple sugar transport system substrate-binding protein
VGDGETDGVSRRALFAAAPLLGAAVALAGCAHGGAGAGGAKALGPARTVAFAVGTPGSDFVTDISLGCADAATMLGWTFRRVLNPQPTPDAHINAIREAVTARNDVIVTVDWYQAVVDEIAAGQKQGAHFALVNSANNPDSLAPLNVPFAGQPSRDNGRLLGARLAAALRAKGVAGGTVLVGNPFPGSANVEERIAGIGEGLAALAGVKMVSFPDGAAQDPVASVGLYRAKMAALGGVVGHAVAGGEMSAVPLMKALGGMSGPRPTVAGWSSSLAALNLVKSGAMDFALDENLYYQGLLAVLMAWSMLERGLPAISLSAGHSWVEPHTVDAMIHSYQLRRQQAVAYGLA